MSRDTYNVKRERVYRKSASGRRKPKLSDLFKTRGQKAGSRKRAFRLGRRK